MYGTPRSVGVLNIYLHLGLGVGLKGKLEEPNICHAKFRKKNNENTLQFSISGQLIGFSLNNRPKGAKKTPGLLFPRYLA